MFYIEKCYRNKIIIIIIITIRACLLYANSVTQAELNR